MSDTVHEWVLTTEAPGVGSGMGSAQGVGATPFNDAGVQNGFQSQQSGFQGQQSGFQSQQSGLQGQQGNFQSQQGTPGHAQSSLASQSSFQQSTGQPPFLVQYGTSTQGQCSCPVTHPKHHGPDFTSASLTQAAHYAHSRNTLSTLHCHSSVSSLSSTVSVQCHIAVLSSVNLQAFLSSHHLQLLGSMHPAAECELLFTVA